jgi:hypothetical protein
LRERDALYGDEIVGALNDAKVVVLVLSGHSVASPHVGKEIERASCKRRRIIAFHTDTGTQMSKSKASGVICI